MSLQKGHNFEGVSHKIIGAAIEEKVILPQRHHYLQQRSLLKLLGVRVAKDQKAVYPLSHRLPI